MKKKKSPDYPFDEVFARAKKLVENGTMIFQKFTCEHCGSRQTINVPNRFYTKGACEECNSVTDIKKNGCNFVAVFKSSQN